MADLGRSSAEPAAPAPYLLWGVLAACAVALAIGSIVFALSGSERREPQRIAIRAQQPGAVPAPNLAAVEVEFAVDLGGETSMQGLRALWASLRGNHAALQNLRPLVSVRDGAQPGTVELRLVAGPFANAAAAARVCAALAGKRVACATTVFDGQRLGLR
jgi:hypothetical protein